MLTVLASSNAGKAREFDRLLGPQLEIIPLPEGVSLPEETGGTFAENARLKAEAVASEVREGVAVLADDSGLEVEVLDGEPGVRSARYAGDGATDEENVRKLLDELEGEQRRDARFVCALCMVVPADMAGESGRVVLEVEGLLEGQITRIPRGEQGFGYDPVFQPAGRDWTLAEADPFAKDGVSHRGAAAQELLRRMSQVVSAVAEGHGGRGT